MEKFIQRGVSLVLGVAYMAIIYDIPFMFTLTVDGDLLQERQFLFNPLLLRPKRNPTRGNIMKQLSMTSKGILRYPLSNRNISETGW